MVKLYCDICDIETKDISGEFKTVEVNIMKPQKEPSISVYSLCFGCARDLKRKVVELIQEKKNGK